MAEASRDSNRVTTLLGVNDITGVVQPILVNSSGEILISMTGGGSGDVVGPGSATDNAVVRFDGATGALVQNSVVIIGDTGAMTGVLTFNGLTITSNGTNTLNIAAGKSLTVSNTITLAGTDATVMTFPTTTATIARTDAANTFTGVQSMTSPSITTSLTTPSTTFGLLSATATTINFAGASAAVVNLGGGATAAQLRFLEPSGSGTNYSAFQAVAQGADITYSLPPTVGAAGTFLKDAAGDGVLTWAAPAGGGDVVGPAGATDNAIVRFNGATGTSIQDSTISVGDTGILAPVTTDTGALGSVTLMWSDLFLASGSVVNFDNGDVTITHSANTLTVAGGNLVALGNTTATTFNKVTLTAPATGSTLTILDGKTFTVNQTITLAGTDAQTYTFPTTSATIARIDAANTFTGASTASAWVLTSPTITTSLVPTANDGAALGSASNQFSDLFLASGGVVSFASTDWVATHTAGILTVGTGDLRVTTAGTNAASVVTVGGTQTLTAKTLTSPTLTTPSAFTTGGTITLAENTTIALDPAGSADGKFTGLSITATAGYAQAFGDLVYLDPTDSRWEAVDANSASGADGDARGTLGMVVVAGTDGAACTILLNGVIRADAKFPALTINGKCFASETAGSIVQTAPSTSGVVVRVVGSAITADEIYFNPSPDFITIT